MGNVIDWAKGQAAPAAKAEVPTVKVVLEHPAAAKEVAAPEGWRFVPYRDESGLIVEIIALPIRPNP